MRSHDHAKPSHDPEATCCPQVPELRRLRYFYGQMLDSQDFRDEQDYFREKLKLAHRCLHGYGVVCGLRVVPEPREEPCDPQTDRERRELERRLEELERDCAGIEEKAADAEESERRELERELAACQGRLEEVRRLLDELCPPGEPERQPARVVVECGVAIDCQGNEIVLRRPVAVDLWQELSPAERRRLQEGGEEAALYLSLCYCELPVKPVRPVHSDRCGAADGCRHAQIQDSYRLVVSLEEPPVDRRCEPCCCACQDPCLPLARIDGFVRGRPLAPEQIDHGVRRRFGLYDWTTVTGLGWVHGGSYRDAAAGEVLGRGEDSGGLEIRFSRPVRVSTLRPGVVVMTVYEGFAGGSGRSSSVYHLIGTLDLPAGEETTDRVVWRQRSDDRFHEGDLVLLQVKGDFILDECCRPVDGEHPGGRVPLLAEHAGDHHPEPEAEECPEPPDRPGPWTSGDGRGGGTFESWIFIQ